MAKSDDANSSWSELLIADISSQMSQIGRDCFGSNTDWTNVIDKNFVPPFNLNICIHRHLQFSSSEMYNIKLISK
jgi:hypothetical protein